MPNLDFSDVILDPDLAEGPGHIIVLRRKQTISAFGRTVVSVTRFKDVIGVVTVANPNDLERLDDVQRMERHLCFVTKFPLRGPSPGYQPDYVVWRGDSFIVKDFGPYPQFGDGFYQAILGSVDIMDIPAPMRGSYKYNDPANSDIIPLG